jgi:hypothetical protein
MLSEIIKIFVLRIFKDHNKIIEANAIKSIIRRPTAKIPRESLCPDNLMAINKVMKIMIVEINDPIFSFVFNSIKLNHKRDIRTFLNNAR